MVSDADGSTIQLDRDQVSTWLIGREPHGHLHRHLNLPLIRPVVGAESLSNQRLGRFRKNDSTIEARD